MLNQSPESDLPVGFTSFCQDNVHEGQAKRSEKGETVDISFAEAIQDSDECIEEAQWV
jgi:hypothetical protein